MSTTFVEIAISYKADTTKLCAGTIVSLRREPENPVDKNAVRVFLDDEPIGYVTNRASTVPTGCACATKVSKMLCRKEVAGANAKLYKLSVADVSKNEDEELYQKRWLAEVYYQPTWDLTNQSNPTYTLTASGNRILYGDKVTVILNFLKFKPGELVLKLDQNSEGKDIGVIWRSSIMNNRSATAAGEVDSLPDDVLLALKKASEPLPVTPVKLLNTDSYQVSVSLEARNIQNYIPEMDALIKTCTMQAKSVKERVQYMLAQNVPENIIHGVLTAIRPETDTARHCQPQQLYLQSVKNDSLTRALGYYLAGKNIRLVGEKGSGKNTLVASVCWLFNQPMCRIQGNSDMDKMDLLGSLTLTNNGTVFEPSSFITTLQNGGVVVLDEINTIKPEIAIILHSITDEAKSIEIPGYGLVKIHPNARIFATMNEDYVGTGELNSATADRFVPLFLDDQMDMTKLLKTMFPDAPADTIQICTVLYQKIQTAVQSGRCTVDAITTRGFIDAVASSKWLPIKTALLDNVGNRPQDRDDRIAISEFINAICPV